jgi:hypothetical protein
MSIPHLLLFVKGSLFAEKSGFTDYASLHAWLCSAAAKSGAMMLETSTTSGFALPSTREDEQFSLAAAALWQAYQAAIKEVAQVFEPLWQLAQGEYLSSAEVINAEFKAGAIDAKQRDDRLSEARSKRDQSLGNEYEAYQAVNGPAYELYVHGLKFLHENQYGKGDASASDTVVSCVAGVCNSNTIN